MSKTIEVIEISIRNWDEFNYRKDVKHPSWFRVDHGIFDDPDFYPFSREELCFWFYILAQASKKSNGTVRLNIEHASVAARFNRDVIFSSIEKLTQLQIVHGDVTCPLRGRYVSVTQTCATDRQTDRQDTSLSFLSAIEGIYKTYPRKTGKSPGLKTLSKQIRSEEVLAEFKTAVAKYSASKVVMDGYPMGFDRFAKQWRDWLDADAGTQGVTTVAPKLKGPEDLKREVAS